MLLYFKSRLDRMVLHKRPEVSSEFCRAAMLDRRYANGANIQAGHGQVQELRLYIDTSSIF
jgi:hypothetical protein